MNCVEVLHSCFAKVKHGKLSMCWQSKAGVVFFIVSVFSIEDVMSSKVLRDMEHGWPGQLASKTT